MEQKIVLNNETGMHARPAGVFVKLAQQFQSQVNVTFSGKSVNGKSVMSLLTLGLKNGSEFQITTNGSDESDALKALIALVESKFNHE